MTPLGLIGPLNLNANKLIRSASQEGIERKSFLLKKTPFLRGVASPECIISTYFGQKIQLFKLRMIFQSLYWFIIMLLIHNKTYNTYSCQEVILKPGRTVFILTIQTQQQYLPYNLKKLIWLPGNISKLALETWQTFSADTSKLVLSKWQTCSADTTVIMPIYIVL